mmetsp:Transcript_68281/g.193411  ORF Transcript_68281/g.193411 Transcript_68281/m.193411 type:complete len:221 (-) Transcript_68281:494-1156(-)
MPVGPAAWMRIQEGCVHNTVVHKMKSVQVILKRMANQDAVAGQEFEDLPLCVHWRRLRGREGLRGDATELGEVVGHGLWGHHQRVVEHGPVRPEQGDARERGARGRHDHLAVDGPQLGAVLIVPRARGQVARATAGGRGPARGTSHALRGVAAPRQLFRRGHEGADRHPGRLWLGPPSPLGRARPLAGHRRLGLRGEECAEHAAGRSMNPPVREMLNLSC